MEATTVIHFDAASHTYTDSNKEVYTSVTTLIGQYKPPFNKRYWSMYVALRDSFYSVRPTKDLKGIWVDNKLISIDKLYNTPLNNSKVLKVIEKWNKLTEIACARGNKIHDGLEDDINLSKGDLEGESNKLIKPVTDQEKIVVFKTKHDLDKTSMKTEFLVIYERLLAYVEAGWTLFAEKRIYSTTYKIAGMIDVLAVKGKYFAILDWKTNKDELLFKSGYYKKEWAGEGEDRKYVKTNVFVDKKDYLYFPVNHVENCKGMIYSLQLNLYAYIMMLWGFKLVPNGLEIFHIRPELEPQLVKVPTMQDEIDLMVKHHLKYNVQGKKLIQQTLGATPMFGIN